MCMRQPALGPGFAVGVLGLALLTGCRATRPCAGSPTAPCPDAAVAAAPPTGSHPAPLSESAGTTVQKPPTSEPTPDASAGEMTTVRKPTESASSETPAVVPPEPAGDSVVPSSHDRVFLEVKEELERLRCGSEPSENPARAHAADYSWLVGELHYVHVRGAWRLRYGTPNEDDRYGGTVTLKGVETVPGFKNGQLVRVEGQLLDPASREPSPVYQVRTVKLLATP